MSSISSSSTATLQAADKTNDKPLADATRKLAADRQAKANDTTLRADQSAISTATKSASSIDAQLAKASPSSPGLKVTA